VVVASKQIDVMSSQPSFDYGVWSSAIEIVGTTGGWWRIVAIKTHRVWRAYFGAIGPWQHAEELSQRRQTSDTDMTSLAGRYSGRGRYYRKLM
jgi:hypothetical protein